MKGLIFLEIFLDSEESWHADGLKLDLVTPMKRWNVSYEGPMVHQATGKVHQVKLKVIRRTVLSRHDLTSKTRDDLIMITRADSKFTYL